MDLENFWDSPMVGSIAFHPQKAGAKYLNDTSGPIRDGLFDVSGGEKVCYRLYLPPTAASTVVYHFHGNAEVCTDADSVASFFHAQGAAVLSIDYRGYGWGTGQAALSKLCPDAESCFDASQAVLDQAGCGTARRVMWGRSIGATCAVHLAASRASKVYGLIVDSGLMSIKQLPMVGMMAQQMFGPQAGGMITMLPEPNATFDKLAAVSCPVVVMHGERDEIIPIVQAVQCHERCGTADKKLLRWPTAGHNDVGLLCRPQWEAAVLEMLGSAARFANEFPAGLDVEAHSLSAADFNGMRGRVSGARADRVLVQFGPPKGEVALKPQNLKPA